MENDNPAPAPAEEPMPAGGDEKMPPADDRTGSVLTKDLKGDPKSEDGRPGEGDGGQDPAKKEGDPADKELAVPEKPEGYEATFPEGTEVDQELLTAYRGKAHELGLNQKQFQELAGLYAEKVADEHDRFRKAQFDNVDQVGLKWAEKLKARPTYEADLGHATKALAQFGSQELYEYFDVSMAGNYPPMFDFVVAVGKALAEPDFKGRGGSSSEKSAAEILYPNQGK